MRDVQIVVARLRAAGHTIRLTRDCVVIAGDVFVTLDAFLRELWRRREVEQAA